MRKLGERVVVQLAAGAGHGAAVTDAGDVYCWGDADYGQVGKGYTNERARALGADAGVQFAPRFVAGLLGVPVARVACGPAYTAAVTRRGEVWGWGDGGCGQLGSGRVTAAAEPRRAIERARRARGCSGGVARIRVCVCAWLYVCV